MEVTKVQKKGLWWSVLERKENIKINNDDFTKEEAIEIATQFLTKNHDLNPLSFAYPGRSGYIKFSVGGKQIWVYMYWESGLSISFKLPSMDNKPVRIDDQTKIPGFELAKVNQ
jgi:hypothetical protein